MNDSKDKKIAKKFSRFLKKRMDDGGFSEKSLSEQSKIGHVSIRAITKGLAGAKFEPVNPTLSRAKRLLDAVGSSLREFEDEL